MPDACRPASARAVLISKAGSVLTVLVGTTVLIGWFFDLPRLTYVFVPFGPNVKTNAGLAITCAGLANLLLLDRRAPFRRRFVGWVLAAVCLVIGAVTLSEHLTGWDLRIDQLLATEAPGAIATTQPNRMGPPASAALLLIGLALLLLEARGERARKTGHAAVLLASLIALLPLVGYAYGLTALYGVARYTGIALSTALVIQILALAVVAGRPDVGLARVLCRDDESGAMARELLAAALLLTFGVGWIVASAFSLGLMDGVFAICTMTLVLIIGLTGLIWRTSAALGRALDQRAAIGTALEASAASLREMDRQKNAFLATLSHELRNPLAPIRFALQALEGPPASAARARQIISRQVDHLVRLVDDLLDLTRITHNKVQLQLRPVDVHQALRDAADAVSHDVARTNQQLVVTPPATPLWVRADADRLVQILVNLLTNAVRYTPPGGRIDLMADADGDAAVVFRVRDTGKGLGSDDLDRVFDMFVQVGEGRHGGLGIGLALVKGLVELHGGIVQARSAGSGRGAEFRVRLRRTAAPEPASVNESAGTSAEGPQTVLVVDDNVDAADTLRQLLTARGHHVTVTYTAPDALEAALAHVPDVGLIDLGLPGMDGLELARHLRGHPRTAHMRLIAITGWGHDDDRRRALEAGFDAHLTKPADVGVLLSLMQAGEREVQAPQ